MPYYRDTPSEYQDVDPAGVDGPGVVLKPQDYAGYKFDAPDGDREAWEKRICQAFGARRLSTTIAFLDQLTTLCTISYDRAQERWKPSEGELSFAVSLIDSVKPRNQMEAALVAQMVAVHFMQMRVSARVLAEQDVDARDANAREASVAGKLARTFAMQMDTLARLRGKRSTTRQNITVRHEKHIHHHQHLCLPVSGNPGADAWGCAPSGPPPAQGDRHGECIEGTAGAGGCTALPCANQGGYVVPLPRRQGKGRV